MSVQVFPARGRMLRIALLMSVSGAALSVAGAASAAGPRTFSPAWYAARAVTSRPAASAPAAGLANVARSMADMGRAAAAIRRAATLQAQARLGGGAFPATPNGLVVGGLVPASGGWTNAQAPLQTGPADQPSVSIKQTAAKAVLNWRSFNVGARTTLTFDQSAGGANAPGWVVLNRVTDPAAEPSRILGTIKAPGKVFVLNRNGVIFGAGAQVNVGGLVAAAADMSDAQFANNGILSGTAADGTLLPSLTGASALGAVIVQQGALIRTAASASVLTGGGSVLLFGGSVRNDGQIETPGGQTVLAAGQDFILRPGYSVTQNADGTLGGNRTSTTLGTEVAVSAGAGSVTNNGLITATTGDISLVGKTVTQNGVVVSTTSVNQRGTVHLLTGTAEPDGVVALGPASLTTVQLDDSGATAFDSRRSGLIVQSAQSNALLPTDALPDRLDQSRVEITTGGVAEFDGGSLTMAQGGRIAITAGRRAFVGAGAVIDASGVAGQTLPASASTVVVNVQGFEQRDAPINRDAAKINNTDVTLDVNDLTLVPAGADPTNRSYTRGGLLEVSGYLATTGHTIGEWAAIGGTILVASPEFVTQPTSVLNVAGGQLSYQAGKIGATYLIGRDRRLYNAATAPADVLYTGVYGGETVDHPHWGVTDVYRSPMIAPAEIDRPATTVGRDAGSVIIRSATAILDGDIDAGVVTGRTQIAARPAIITDGYTVPQDAAPRGGLLQISNANVLGAEQAPLPIDVRIAASDLPLGSSLTAASPIPADRVDTAWLTPRQIEDSGLSSLTVATAAKVGILDPVRFAPGGTVAITAPITDLSGSIVAPSGRIVITDGLTSSALAAGPLQLQLDGVAGITLHQSASLDVQGVWTNTFADPVHDQSGAGFVAGGSVSLISARSIVLAAGSTIDVSAGAALSSAGVATGGAGGNLTLQADAPNGGGVSNQVTSPGAASPNFAGTATQPARLTLAGTLRGFGVSSGGTLTLGAPSIQVGGVLGLPDPGTLLLPVTTARSGFKTIVLNGHTGLTVAAGTTLSAAAPSYQLALLDRSAPSGSDPADALPLLLPPLYVFDPRHAHLTQRQGVSLVLQSTSLAATGGTRGGPITIGAGALVAVDPGQSVTVETTGGQITVDGTIAAPGGTIALRQDPIAKADLLAYPDRGLSVWLGGASRLDVAGRAVVASDTLGRPYGQVADGGSVVIGSAGTLPSDPATTVTLPNAALGFVAIRPGAVIDASASAATIDRLAGLQPGLNPLQPGAASSLVRLAGSGGTIAIASQIGVALDGILRASGGGAGAAGGTLAVALQTPVTYAPPVSKGRSAATIDPAFLVARRIVVAATAAPPSAETLPPDAAIPDAAIPGAAIPAADIGRASVSTTQIAAGGFDTVALSSTDSILFDGPVSLRVGGRLELSALALSQTGPGANVSVAAPYVLFGKASRGDVPLSDPGAELLGRDFFYPGIAQPGSPTGTGQLSDTTMPGLFQIAGDFVQGSVQFGVSGVVNQTLATSAKVDLAAAALTRIDSTGDLRVGTIQTRGDLAVSAAQVVPFATGGGVVASGTLAAGGTLRIGRSSAALPPMPFDIGNTLALQAATIEQGGIVRAPFGDVLLSGLNGAVAEIVSFLPGSVTSVSAAGVSTLFGGTTDGVNYSVNGVPTAPFQTNPPAGELGLHAALLATTARSVLVQPDATLDLSGGGNVQGAGFITGRGGSTDTLLSPTLEFNAAKGTASVSTGGVYAIMAGAQPGIGAAPPPLNVAGYPGPVPLLGQQIVLHQGVAGLAAGTYTLLPAYYALLPGGYRVEVDNKTRVVSSGARVLEDRSVLTDATLATALTGVRGALPVQVTLTDGAGVRSRSQYDEQTISQYTLAQTKLFGQLRGGLPDDGGLLLLQFPTTTGERTALSFAGRAAFGAGPDGTAGAIALDGILSTNEAPFFEIASAEATATPGFVTIRAADLAAVAAPRLSIGGFLGSSNTPASQTGGPSRDFQSNGAAGVVVRDGARLSAGEVFLIGSVTLEHGAVIDTIGAGPAPYDTDLVGSYNQNVATGIVAVSNGNLRFSPATNDASILVDSGATLLSDGTVGFVTTGQLALQQGVRYGARNISFATGSANIGSAANLAALAARGALPTGLDLSSDTLATLLRGDPESGAPALEQLSLTASRSVNFIGSVTLDTTNGGGTSSLQQLVLNTPAIYGVGGPTDVAALNVGTIYWNGVQDASATPSRSALPGGIVVGGPGVGAGILDIRANRIVLGYAPDDQPNNQLSLDRVTFGFDRVNLAAGVDIEGNNLGTLAVYRQQGTSFTSTGFTGTGGTLALTTPLLTGAAGAVLQLSAGGAIVIAPAPGVPGSPVIADGSGAEIALTAPVVTIDSAVVLPSGRLSVTTSGDIAVGAGARLDVAGRPKAFFDQSRAGWGGTIELESSGGGIRVDPAAAIDVSANAAAAGRLSATAPLGMVDLAGAIVGGSTPGFAGGTIEVRAGTLPDFTGLNTRLNQGGVTGARSFDIKTGDVTVQDVANPGGSSGALLVAHSIALSVDGGALTVDGGIDASGEAPGTIRLAGARGLTLTGRATLDAHATAAQLDSYGVPIDAENRAQVSLTAGGPGTASAATLTIAPGAAIDVSAAPGVTCLLGSAACGTVELNAPRLAGGDIAVAIPGAIAIRGAQSIAAYAMSHFVPADGTIVQTNLTGGVAVDANAIGLDQIDAANRDFIADALPGGAFSVTLATKLAGLAAPYAAQFHLRPGVEIESPAPSSLDPTGALVIPGDLDLSGLRYASVNASLQRSAVYGSGEPGSLTLRAAGSLIVNGSVTDGFAPPAEPTLRGQPTLNPSDNGWLLYTATTGSISNEEPFGADIVLPNSLPAPIKLLAGTIYRNSDTVLGYDIAIDAATLNGGQFLPQPVVLAAPVVVAAEIVATGRIATTGGGIIAKGQIIPANTTLDAGTTLDTGTLLPMPLPIQAGLWRQGGNLDLFAASVSLTQTATLGGGSLIPSGTKMALAANQVATRPAATANGAGSSVQGRVWGGAVPLAAGAQSWSLRLVSGADLGAADSRTLQAASVLGGDGDTVLADDHYIVTTGRRNRVVGVNPAFSVIRTGTGDLDLLSGGALRESSLWGIYTAGTPSPEFGATVAAGGADTLDQGRNVYDLARGLVSGSVLGSNGGVYESLVGASSQYAARYPQGGGDLLLDAQGSITGDIHGGARTPGTGDTARESGAVPNFVWRQGGGTAVDQPTAWWINYGTYVVNPDTRSTDLAALVGFVGVGSLGGGNVTVRTGGELGGETSRGAGGAIYRSGGLDVAVAGSGRVVDGQVVQTGGGRLAIEADGAVNAQPAASDDLNGTWTNLRGHISVNVAALGSVVLDYDNAGGTDPRLLTNVAETATASGGPVLVLGDAQAEIRTRRDLTISGVGDATRTALDTATTPNLQAWNTTPFTFVSDDGQPAFSPSGGNTLFSMWQPSTGIVLDSAGGNVTPFSVGNGAAASGVNDRLVASSPYYLPPNLSVTALGGSIYTAPIVASSGEVPFILAPSPSGQLDLFAGDSIYNVAGPNTVARAIDMSGAPTRSIYNVAGPNTVARAIDMSGAPTQAIASIARPAFNNASPVNPAVAITNADPDTVPAATLFAFNDVDTLSGLLHANDLQPNRVYALNGDVVGLRLGEQLTLQPGFTGTAVQYCAAKPEQIRAGRDVVRPGLQSGITTAAPEQGYDVTGNFILNLRANDVSVVSAGRDIIYANFQVAGPGSLLVQAGRNLYQANVGVLESVGPVIDPDPQSRGDGAGILAFAGVGLAGPDWAGFARLYLDPGNVAVAGTPVGQGVNADRVAAPYDAQLLDWLRQNHGYAGDPAGALAAFLALPAEQQATFLAPIYFDELRLSGREFNDPASVRSKSYARGREAIASLFPSVDDQGAPIVRDGALTLFTGNTTVPDGVGGSTTFTSDGGIRTDRGGSITVLDPAGPVTVGVTGIQPGANAGLLTQGSGDIDIFALGSVLLGQSRVFTTFGGGITVWSAAGDINAGRGSKTTVVSTPQQIIYDDLGTALLSPTVPVTGAGIATLNPIPNVPAGDVDLIAPLGVIDAGEAGIRVSGNANLAALTIVNAGNIQVQGKTVGVPVVVAPNLGALTAAQAASGGAQQSSEQQSERRRKSSDSIITVEVIGFGQ